MQTENWLSSVYVKLAREDHYTLRGTLLFITTRAVFLPGLHTVLGGRELV